MKRLILVSFFLSIVFTGSAAAQRCRPKRHAKIPVVKGQIYEKARKIFIASGWTPFQTNDESTAQTNLHFGNGPLFWKEKGYIEAVACGGTNPGCEFIFKDKYDNKLYVDTYGLEDPVKRTHARITTYRIICDWEFK